MIFAPSIAYHSICLKNSGNLGPTFWPSSVQGSAKSWAPGCVNAAGKARRQAEVVSNSSNKIHQTWEPPFSRALYTTYKRGWRTRTPHPWHFEDWAGRARHSKLELLHTCTSLRLGWPRSHAQIRFLVDIFHSRLLFFAFLTNLNV